MQSIIVYRNPAEAAFWELVTSGDMIPIFGAAVTFIAMYVLFHHLADITLGNTRFRRINLTYWLMLPAAVAAYFAFKFLYIS